jgi:hypothetical protein
MYKGTVLPNYNGTGKEQAIYLNTVDILSIN